MATEWYFLNRGEQVGPVSGKKLRDLADFGEVSPGTPVRRIHDGEKTPWTRAGAIKALFPNDVSDQLGPPICDVCGTVKPDGRCSSCEALEQFVATLLPLAETEAKVKKRYPNLRKHIKIIHTVGGSSIFRPCGLCVCVLRRTRRTLFSSSHVCYYFGSSTKLHILHHDSVYCRTIACFD